MSLPNIDKIAAEGMRFTQMLAGAPVCAPTRSTLMTGKHMGHTSVRRNPGHEALRAEDVTVAQVLKKAGYATGGFGKWGVGGRGTTGVPEKHGFDVFLGYYDQVHAHTFFPAWLVRNSEEVPLKGNTGALYEGETFSHQVIFEESLKFIRDNKDRPFLCYCPWTPPHGAWGLPDDEPSWQKYKGKQWDAGYSTRKDEAPRYAAMVNMIDRQKSSSAVTTAAIRISPTIRILTVSSGLTSIRRPARSSAAARACCMKAACAFRSSCDGPAKSKPDRSAGTWGISPI